MTAFRKFVLISRNELDRIKEKRIRDYDQSLSALARTERDIEELLSDPAISNEDKLGSYYKLSEMFDKLRPGIGSTIPTNGVVPDPNAATLVTPPANQADVRAKEAVAAPFAGVQVDPQAAAAQDVAAVAKPEAGLVLPADVLVVSEVNLPAQYTHKYYRQKFCLTKIRILFARAQTGFL